MRFPQLTSWLLGSLCLLAATSCREDDPKPRTNDWCQIEPYPAPAVVRIGYAQTYCSDPWGEAQGTQQLQTAAMNYLAQHGIASAQLQAIDKNQPAVCNACSCTTGLVLEGVVSEADLAAALALGFKQEKTQQ